MTRLQRDIAGSTQSPWGFVSVVGRRRYTTGGFGPGMVELALTPELFSSGNTASSS